MSRILNVFEAPGTRGPSDIAPRPDKLSYGMIVTPPQAVLIAGPNGSGKSTAASFLLPPNMTFVNADLIAQEISGKPGIMGDINAGRLLIGKVEVLERTMEDFAFETTLATKLLADRVKVWSDLGYLVRLIFFSLRSPELAVERVASRVLLGGHDVPEPTIRRRYVAGIRNLFDLYMPLVHRWRVYDNSEDAPSIIAKGDGAHCEVFQRDLWSWIISQRS